jgi:hypothetical protein
MEDEDFNFDEFMENSNRDFEMKLQEYQENMMKIAIETNYNQIERNGINEWHLRHMSPLELKDLVHTFKMMIDHFESIEDYEKCAVVLKEQNKINTIMASKQDI